MLADRIYLGSTPVDSVFLDMIEAWARPTFDFYVDSLLGSDTGTGTEGDPWQTLAKVSASLAAGRRIGLKRGGTWEEALTVSHHNVTIGAYGTGADPIIDGSDPHPTGWTLVSGAVYSKLVGHSVGASVNGSPGVVLHGGEPLPWVEWNTDQATTTATMSGAAYAATGCFTHDKNQTVYVRLPSGANPNTSGSVRVGMRQDCISVVSRNNVTIQDLDLRGFARHGMWAYGVTDLQVYATISRGGGMWAPAGNFYVGNGLDLGGVSTGVTYDLTVTDVFDSAMTPQVYENGANVSNVSGTLTATRCGYAALEVTILPEASGNIDGVNVKVTARDIGKGWAGQRGSADHSLLVGHGVLVETGVDNGTISNVTLPDLDVEGCAGWGVFINRAAGRVTVTADTAYPRLVGNDTGGVTCRTVLDGETAAITLHDALVVDNGGPGFDHNNFKGGAFDVQRCTIARNGSDNFMVDGFINPPVLKDCALQGDGGRAAWFRYWPTRSGVVNNVYHRADAGAVVSNNSTDYTTQATYRSGTGESTAIFADPQFTYPEGGNYAPVPGSPLIGAGTGSITVGALGAVLTETLAEVAGAAPTHVHQARATTETFATAIPAGQPITVYALVAGPVGVLSNLMVRNAATPALEAMRLQESSSTVGQFVVAGYPSAGGAASAFARINGSIPSDGSRVLLGATRRSAAVVARARGHATVTAAVEGMPSYDIDQLRSFGLTEWLRVWVFQGDHDEPTAEAVFDWLATVYGVA